MSTRRKRRKKSPFQKGKNFLSINPETQNPAGVKPSKGGGGGSSAAGQVASGISQGIAAATGAAVSQGVSAAAPYVPPSTSSASAASPQAAAEKAVKELGYLSSYLKDGKKGKSESIASSYEKRTEKARKTRQRQEAKVADIGKKIQAKYNTEDSRRRTQGVPGLAATKTGISEGLKALEKTKAPKPRKIAKKLTKAVAKSGPSLDRKFGPNETITQKQAALLAESVGLPGKTYGQIAIGESGIRPAAISSDGGYGLWQMTPRVQSAETKAAWDKIASQHKGGYLNPVANAEMAKYLAGDSTGVSNYYGTGSVTDPDAHLKIGPEGAAKKLAAKPVPKAIKQKARQTLGKKPTKAILQGGKVVKDTGKDKKRTLVVREMFYDPGVNLKDGADTSAIGGHTDHLHFASDDPASMLMVAKKAQSLGMLQGGTGENPAFDTIDAQHAPDGYHYREMPLPKGRLKRQSGAEGKVLGEALDIAGSPEQMAALNKWIASNAGEGVSTAPVTVPIQGTSLAVKVPTPTTTSSGTTATGTTSGVPTTSTTSSGIDPRALTTLKKQSRSGQSVSRTLDKIEARLTTPLTELPEISQELIDAILRKYR